MPNNDVISQATQVATRYARRKPKDIHVTREDWLAAGPETRSLLIQVSQLISPLEETYWEAVRYENWHRALLLYQRLSWPPFLYSLCRVIHTERQCRKHEADYIARAQEWISEVESLLYQV